MLRINQNYLLKTISLSDLFFINLNVLLWLVNLNAIWKKIEKIENFIF